MSSYIATARFSEAAIDGYFFTTNSLIIKERLVIVKCKSNINYDKRINTVPTKLGISTKPKNIVHKIFSYYVHKKFSYFLNKQWAESELSEKSIMHLHYDAFFLYKMIV